MDITLDKKNETHALLNVKLGEEDYRDNLDKKIKDYSRKATMKGFRPGKVPVALIKKMYGSSLLLEEVNDQLLKAVNGYISENKLPLLGEPLPVKDQKSIDPKTQTDFDFTFELGIAPEFDVDLGNNLSATRHHIKPTKKEIEETVEDLRGRNGKMENPEVSEAGDKIYGKLAATDGEFSENVLLDIDKVKKSEQKQFIGIQKEDTVTFDLRKALDEATIGDITGLEDDDLEKLQGEFTLTVENINRQGKAELDQEFFDQMFGKDEVSNEDEFMKKLEETLAENYDKETESFLDAQLQRKLVSQTEMELPDEFLKRWLVESNDDITMEQVEKEYQFYVQELKWSLIKGKIAEKNDVKITNEEIREKAKEAIRHQFAAYGMAEQIEANIDGFVDNYLNNENGKNQRMLAEDILKGHVMKAIKSEAKIEEKDVSLDEFKAIAEKASKEAKEEAEKK